MQPIPPSSTFTLESLLAHADWVRALARTLVADPASADDVEQEVWRAALENPPREVSNPRGWLASVARNAARSLGRAGARREQRERGSAKPEALPATSELVAEAELARELAGEVLALEEPYRTVLLLRYWRSLSPDEIASAQSLPCETVRTQLKRGLERLRERLDRRFGDREQWLAALAPLAKDAHLLLGSATSAVGGGVLLLSLKIAAAATLAATAWWAWPTRVQHATEQAHVEQEQSASPPPLEVAENEQSSRATADTKASVVSRSSTEIVSSAKSSLSGHAIDLEGKPISGLELEWHAKRDPRWPHWDGTRLVLRHTSVEIPIRIRDLMRVHPEEVEKLIADVGDEPGFRDALLGIPEARPTARTGLDGRFEFSLGEGEWDLVLTDSRRTVVAELSSPRNPDWTLVVAPCVRVAGVVVDESGEAMENASVSFSTSLASLASFPQSAGDLIEHEEQAQTGSDGTFQLERVPLVHGHMLECRVRGFDSAQVEVPASGTDSMRIVMKRARSEQRATISGLVLDVDGLPAKDAFVQLGQDGAGTDEHGRFEFPLTCSHGGSPLTATKRGLQAAVLEKFGEDKLVSHSDVLLRFGPAALTITGRVLLADGSVPKKGHVQVADGTPCGSNSCYLEDATEGHYRLGVTIDPEGRFSLGGLRDRNYRLLAWAEGVGQIVCSEPLAAGSKDIVLQASNEDFFERLEGRVQTRRGVPVERAEVFISMPIHRMTGGSSSQPFGRVHTDAEGKFVLRRVPRTWSVLTVAGDGVHYDSLPVPQSANVPITITVRLEVRTTAEVADDRVDALRFFDVEGHPVSPSIHWPGVISMQEEVHRNQGSFPVFDLLDDAVTAVLFQGKTELRRVPIEVRREKLLTLHL